MSVSKARVTPEGDFLLITTEGSEPPCTLVIYDEAKGEEKGRMRFKQAIVDVLPRNDL